MSQKTMVHVRATDVVVNISVCVEEVKLQLLAKSVYVPGLPNLLFSLIKSCGDESAHHKLVSRCCRDCNCTVLCSSIFDDAHARDCTSA